MIEVVSLQNKFLSSKPIGDRKVLGQFFTGQTVSEYMASLVSQPENKHVRLLDAGAGVGILAASTEIRCLGLGCNSVHAVLYEVLYEVDEQVIPHLERTMAIVGIAFKERKAEFTYEVKNEDFILARPDKDPAIEAFDVSVINSSYFKYSVKDSLYAKAVSDLYKGDPNIYASFMAVVMACLKSHGEMISISPQSFTNILYFKGFRQYFLNESSLKLIHIFRSRNKVFQDKNSKVLQENVICSFLKGNKSKVVTVRTSMCDASIGEAKEHDYPTDLIVDSSNHLKIIRIPESERDAQILKQAETLATTFEDARYFIATGRVVEHRTRNFITKKNKSKNTVPLYRPHNVTPILASWTGVHKKDVSFKLNGNHDKHTMQNGTYVLLKRFSSKDEKCRLVSAVHLVNGSGHDLIGFGNKLNYIGVVNGVLTVEEAYRLAAIFNSTFMDKYFRCISDNTQVNSTEIRVFKFPARKTVVKIGHLVLKANNTSQDVVDAIINQQLKI